MTNKKRGKRETPSFYAGKVSFDIGPKFSAQVQTETWNGWAVPYFTKAQAMKVAEYVNAHPDYFRMKVIFVGDAFIVIDLDNPKERPETVESVVMRGKPYYQLAPGWTWWKE